jgi:hypothetical protein
MSSSSYVDAVVGTVAAGNSGAVKLPRLTSTGYAKWRPDAENSFKRYGLKESDYKKEIKNYEEVKSYADLLDEQETVAATDFILAKLSGSVRTQSASASSPAKQEVKPIVSPPASDDVEKAHNKMIRGVIERSNRVFALLYESLSDDIRVLVNNNSAIVDGYGYSLWKWLELKYQSTEGDSVGKLWSDFTTAVQRDDEDWEKYKAKVDAIVRLLAAAKQVVPPALYATILLDRLVPKYNGIKMAIDSTKELGKDRENVDWSVVSKFIQAQERTMERQNDPELRGASAREAQALSATSQLSVMQNGRRSPVSFQKSDDPDLPFKGKNSCWHCGMKNHSFRKCFKWLAKHGNGGGSATHVHDGSGRSAAASRNSSPSRASSGATAHSLVATTKNKYDALTPEREDEEPSEVRATVADRGFSCVAIVNSAAMNQKLTRRMKSVRFADDSDRVAVQPRLENASAAGVECNSVAIGMPVKQRVHDDSKFSAGGDWGIDSMSSIHASGNRSLFTNIRNGNPIEVTVANKQVVKTREIGDVKVTIQCANDEQYSFTVTAYLHASFAANLLSAQLLRKADFEVHLAKQSWLVTPDGKTAALRTDKDLTILESLGNRRPAAVYLADISSAPVTKSESAMALGCAPQSLKTAEDLMQLHVLFGHCAWSTLKNIVMNQKTDGVSEFAVPAAEVKKAVDAVVNCKVCVESAGKCAPYGHRGLDRGTRVNESLHFDTFYVRNGDAFEYGLAVRDAYANTIFVYTMKNRDKDTCCPLIVDCINLLETQTGMKVKRLHSDGGGEFINDTLKSFCRMKGISLFWPPKDKHQLNGMAENCVQLAKLGIRKLLRGCGLPDIPYWRYAARHFMFTWNRLMVSKYTGKTPYELLFGKKPTCERWGVFGCDVNYHVPKGERMTTFSRTMEPGIYLGHDPARNCPAVLCLATGKVIYTRDVRYLRHSFENAKRVVQGDGDNAVAGVVAPATVADQNEATPQPRRPPGLPLDSDHESKESVSDETYEVEQIVDHRTRRGRREYQVKWVGYPIEQSTWQSRGQLIEDGCKLSIDRYEAALKGEVIDDPDEDSKAMAMNEPKPEAEAKAGSNANVATTRIQFGVATDSPNAVNLTESDHEDESIRHALSDDHTAVAIRQAEIAMCAFSAGYAEPAHNQSDSRRRIELACAIAAGTSVLEAQTPKNYREAITCPDAREWMDSMDEEWKSLEEQGVWVYTKRKDLPRHANVLPSKFVYRVKLTESGQIDKRKSRLCPGGHRQKPGIDYGEVFSSTGKYKTLRLMLSIAAKGDFNMHQMDVPSAFTKAGLEENVYMEIPEPYRTGREDEVLDLRKSLYGLHQANRNWWLLVTKFLVEQLQFRQSVCDLSLFFKRTKTGQLMLVFVFVDDFYANTQNGDEEEWEHYLAELTKEFNIKYLGEPTWLLGMRITRDRQKRLIKLDQELYVAKALEKFGFTECRTVDTPEEMQAKKGEKTHSGDADLPADRVEYMEKVGTLIYASISTRPDIAHAVHQCAAHMQQPSRKHMKAVDRIFRYLAGTKEMGLIFGSRLTEDARGNTTHLPVSAYSDADWGNDVPDRKSLTGWVVMVNGDPVSWCCKKQSVVAQSTCEAELYALAAAVNELMWFMDLIRELGLIPCGASGVGSGDFKRRNVAAAPAAHAGRERPSSDSPSLCATQSDSNSFFGPLVHVDNQSAIKVAKNGVKADRTKHIDIKYHFVTETLNKKIIQLNWVPTEEQQADIFTKGLAAEKFARFRSALMNCDMARL